MAEAVRAEAVLRPVESPLPRLRLAPRLVGHAARDVVRNHLERCQREGGGKAGAHRVDFDRILAPDGDDERSLRHLRRRHRRLLHRRLRRLRRRRRRLIRRRLRRCRPATKLSLLRRVGKALQLDEVPVRVAQQSVVDAEPLRRSRRLLRRAPPARQRLCKGAVDVVRQQAHHGRVASGGHRAHGWTRRRARSLWHDPERRGATRESKEEHATVAAEREAKIVAVEASCVGESRGVEEGDAAAQHHRVFCYSCARVLGAGGRVYWDSIGSCGGRG